MADKVDNKETIKELRSNRGYTKGAITRLCNSCSDAELQNMSLSNLRVKKEKLELLYTEYETYNKKLLFLSDNDDEDMASIEIKYYEIMSKLRDTIDNNSSYERTVNLTSPKKVYSRTNLPTIQMNSFKGEYSEYQPFISLFDSLIHRDRHLDSLQKLYYLRSYLKNEPYDLIKNLPLTSDSYDKAKKLLDDRYNNKYKILNEHIAQLLDLLPLTKSTSANIRNFVSNTKQTLAAIENLEVQIKTWDPIILCILTRKLDTYTARAYQMERDDNTEPAVKNFIDYLEKRALAMENAEPTTSKSSKVVVNVAAQNKALMTGCFHYPAPEIQKYGWGVRHIQTFLLFFSLTILYMARSQLGVTIVAMTILPNINATVNNSDYLLNMEAVDGNNSELMTSQNNNIVFENNFENYTYEEIDTSSLYRKYVWSKPIQEMIQSSFFLGYVLTQFLLSIVAQRWGGKICLQIGLSVNAITSFVMPWLVLWGGWKAMCAVRVVQGLTQAGTYPSLQLMLAEWVPKNERGTLNSYVYTGGTVGTVLGFQLAGIVSDSFGWPAVFWGAGILCSLTYVLLTIFGSDSPYKHKSITEEEKNYITQAEGSQPKQKSKLPWKSMWTSRHVWAIYATHCGSGFTYLFMLTQVPTYVHYALDVDVKNSGILSSLPYFASMFTAIFFGILSDCITNRNILSVKNGRRLFNSISQFGVAFCLIAFTYTKDVGVSIFLLVTALACNSGINVGWMINYIDLAPNFGGTLVAIGNTMLNMLILLVPVLVSYIVTDVADQYQWRILFILAASITLAANAVFVVFMSAETQPWNDMEYEQTDTELKKTKEKN